MGLQKNFFRNPGDFYFFLLTPGKNPYTLHIHKFFLDLSSFFNGTFRVQLDENPPDYGVFI